MDGPTIAIVGSARQAILDDTAQSDQVREAAEQIGRKLALSQCRIIVYSSDEGFIEPTVVRGFLGENPGEKSIICIANEEYPIEYQGMDDPNGPFETFIDPNPDWEIAFYQSLHDRADGVLLIGGGATTLAAGLVAVHANKALYSVAAFGGGANTAWKYLSANPHLETSDERRHMKIWQGEPSAARCVEALIRQTGVAATESAKRAALESRLKEMTRLKRQNLPALSTVALFVAILIFSLSRLPGFGTTWFWISLFCVLMSAGLMGSSVRLLLRPVLTHPRGTTAVLGIVAGLVVGLSYLLPQLIAGSSGTVSATVAESDKTSSTIAYFLAPALIALSAGFGFDYAFEKWRETSRADVDTGFGTARG
jgi:hypothetical protein